MGKLTDLSNELLLNITSHLSTEDEDDTRALLHLCRTSRLLFNVAQPELYRCVRLDRLAADPLVQSKLFLRTLMEFPSLAQKTKELAVFTELGVDFEWPALEHDSVFMDLVAVVGGNPADLEPEICYGPLAVPIVARLTNLEHLHLTARIKVPPSLMQRIHELQADRSILPKLKTFHLYKMYEDDPVNIDEYVPLLRYPSFEKFTSDCDIRYNQDGYPATNTITHTAVELFWCLRPLPGMERLFNACSHLTVFKFLVPDWRCFRWAGDVMSEPLVVPRDLVKALLRTHRQNLQTLHLDFHYYYDLHDPELLEEIEEPLEHCEYTYPSFRDFERLSHITIEFEKLVKLRDLPASLEHLELHYCRFAELDKAYLNDLIELKSKWCPVVKSITLNGFDDTNNRITKIQELIMSLDMPVQVTVHGRLLEISGAGYHLTIKNLAPSLIDTSVDEASMGTDNMVETWVRETQQQGTQC